ncbi:glycosyltransferase [Candidatus Enterococcus mansonii]|uniref:Glycosyltransferase 2-like domain-containing protein n=1 Tax=Candidatus Enterococcus mansonii TaxID=1834181 RepID=A0A242CHN8_9ENTE|nr:glycosyltransferase [Enterococcus sp. 4G2_DIV0659]OTO09745.1 hypothetical protein A5880_000426 [Enterococcus sp. 4G2_DIV0659]
MKMIDVSVLMSIYKKEKVSYFIETMDSIMNQTVQPKEILLIEDGPLTADLIEAIQNYKQLLGDQFVTKSLKENVGLGRALAEGVNLCKYQLIARMDTDDIMSPNRLESQFKEFRENPELTIVGSNIAEFSGDTNHILGNRIVPEKNGEIRVFSKRRNPFNHMTVMFRKDAVIQVGNYQPLQGFEDYYLWVRLLKNGYQAKNIQEKLVFARTGLDMYARRGGLAYLIPGLKARKVIYKEGLGTITDLLVVSGIHIMICLMPNKIRGKFYEKKLRN